MCILQILYYAYANIPKSEKKNLKSEIKGFQRLGQWLTLIIPTTQEAEMGRLMFQGQTGQKVRLDKTPSQPITRHSGAHRSSQICGKYK
jgi:hypothetical protein